MYNLCDVSFGEIASFLQRSFSMSGSQAEVVAKRLWDTFHAFDLSAHPTYFAGIPRETLMALLHAHRRVELLQLAVDGFLTVVVAEDKSDVALSRTTRARFLSNIVVDLHLELRSYSSAELVEAADEFAQEQDFDIDALDFIQAFERKGILHFEDGKVAFSLPFIERYLLARRLAEREDLARQYFDMDSKTFHPQVFDLYAEMGAHEVIKERVVAEMERSMVAVKPLVGDEHILLTNDINPRWGASAAHVTQLRKRLTKAVSDVQEGRSDREDKQRILDLRERIGSGHAARARATIKEERSEELAKLCDAVISFQIGVMLLGSGAEALRADEKRTLALRLVELASSIVDVWTRRIRDFDFANFRKYYLSEPFIEEFANVSENGPKREELKKPLMHMAPVARVCHQMLRLRLGRGNG